MEKLEIEILNPKFKMLTSHFQFNTWMSIDWPLNHEVDIHPQPRMPKYRRTTLIFHFGIEFWKKKHILKFHAKEPLCFFQIFGTLFENFRDHFRTDVELVGSSTQYYIRRGVFQPIASIRTSNLYWNRFAVITLLKKWILIQFGVH